MALQHQIQFKVYAASVRGGLQKRAAFKQIVQAENWPHIVAALVGSAQESITADRSLRGLVIKFILHEAPESLYLVDDEAGRNFPVVDGDNPRTAPQ